jgi:chromosome segregation ATPase
VVGPAERKYVDNTEVALRDEIKTLNNSLAERENKIKALVNGNGVSVYAEEIEKLKGTVETLSRTLVERDKKITELERVVAARGRKIKELRETLVRENEVTQALDVDIEGRMNDVKSLTSTLLDRDRRITELERIVGVREDDLKMLRDEISRLEKVATSRAQEATDIRARALRLHKALQDAWWVQAAEDLQELREWAES